MTPDTTSTNAPAAQNGRRKRRHALPPLEPRPVAAPKVHAKNVVGDADRLRESFSMLQEIFEVFLRVKMADQNTAASEGAKPWTPRSAEPMEGLSERIPLPARIRRGRVEFDCPACRRRTELPEAQLGAKARCQKCFSAIIVPTLGNQRNGSNCERDVESILHPERFQVMPMQGWARVRSRHLHQLGVLTLLSMLFMAQAFYSFRKLMRNRTQIPTAVVQTTTEKNSSPELRAEEVVKQYLAAKSPDAKAAFVRNGSRVRNLMASYFARHPEALYTSQWQNVASEGTGFYEGKELQSSVTSVKVELASGTTQTFTVEHTADGPKIDWETSVGYSPQEWPEVLVSIEKPAPLRVLAALDDYYNYDFADEAGQICIRLQDPVSKELLGYGYLPRNHPAAPVLEEILEDASPRAPRPITVEVAATQKSPRTKQLKITNILADGWREHGNVILASAGLPTAVTH